MPHNPTSQGHKGLVGAVFLSGLVLYGLTCAPGVLWQDCAMFQFRVWHGDYAGDLGLALAHPLYILLAKAFTVLPLGDFAFRVNLFSAVCGAACLAFAVDLLLVLTGSRTAAVSGTILLAVSHTFWTHAVIPEVYSLYALGLLVELWLLERFFSRRRVRWLTFACLICGLNLSNHLLALLHVPAYIGVIIWAVRAGRLHAKQLPLLIAAFVCGTMPYLALIIADIAGGEPIVQTFKEALVGPPHRAKKVFVYDFSFARQTFKAIQYFVLNFPTPLAFLAPVGLWLGWKQLRTRWFIAVAAAIFVVAFVFAFRYLVPDQYVFFMPCYVLFALLVAVAIPRVASSAPLRQAVCLVLAAVPLGVYEVAPQLMERWNISIGATRDIPYRDSYAYFIRPRKNGDNGAERFAREALAQAAPDGLLIADTSINNVLVYVRDIQGIHRDVTLNTGHDTTPVPPAVPPTPEATRPFAQRHAAFVCSDAPGYVWPWISEEYDLVPAGVVFRLAMRP